MTKSEIEFAERQKEKLVELLRCENRCPESLERCGEDCPYFDISKAYCCDENRATADMLISHGVTVQECAYWQYIEDDVDEDNNIQAYCSVCHAGDKHATSMIGKVPYCWKCGRKMMPKPPKGE